MPSVPANRLIDQLFRCTLPGDGDEPADGELLSRFIERHDEAAFAAILRRHAGMVWGVCHRALQRQQDAEDAFQSTFLVLVRKATSIVPRGNVGNWLYGVANQVTTHAKRGIARRRTREVQVIEMPDTPAQPGLSLDLRFVLDEELVRLPDIYRAVVVLCDLEGRTRKETARLLGVPDGTVGGRLARARALLAERLTRRGVVFSSGSLAAALSAASVSASAPPALVSSTIKAASLLAAGPAAGILSAKVAALTEGVVKAMFVYKLKAALSAVLVLGLLASGATFLTYRTAAGHEGKKPATDKAAEPLPQQEKEKNAYTAWGKEVGGLQVGLGFRPGEHRVYSPGETVKVVLRVRNVSKDPVEFKHIWGFFLENPPKITDVDGMIVQLPNYRTGDREAHMPRINNVVPGKAVELYEWTFDLQPKIEHSSRSFIPGTGQFSLQCDRTVGPTRLNQDHPNPTLDKLATGVLKLEIKDAKKLSDKEASGKEVDLLQGEWAIKAWQEEGVEESVYASADELKGKKLLINGNVMSGVGSGIGGSMSFKLNSEKTPNEIDLTILDGKRKGITEPGIYKIEGDQLRICFGGKVRPKEFTPKAGSGHALLTLQKEPLTAWGKEVGGLQAGLSISNASDIQLGGKATVVLRLRNVSNDPITASAWPLWLIKPTIADGAGKQVRTTSPSSPGFDLSATDITLKPGQSVVVATNSIFVVDADAKGPVRHEGVADQFTIHVRPGKHSVDLKGFLEGRSTVATGTVDFEVKADKKEKPDAPAAKPNNNGPATEKKPRNREPQEMPVTKEEKLRVLIDKVLAAHGGEDKLKKLTSFTMTYKYSTGEMHQYFIQQPMNFRLETTHPDQTTKQIMVVFPNGRRWWTKEPKEEPKEFVPTGAEITEEFWLDHVKFFGPRHVLRLKDADHKVVLLDEETKIGDRPAVGVKVTGPHYKHTMYFDKESHLLVQGVGSDVLREVVFSDYKKFDGIPIARKENDGIPVWVEITDFKEEKLFDAKLFEIPQMKNEGGLQGGGFIPLIPTKRP